MKTKWPQAAALVFGLALIIVPGFGEDLISPHMGRLLRLFLALGGVALSVWALNSMRKT